MKRILIILFLLPFALHAQPTLDTIRIAFRSKPHLYAKVDTRNSFIENSRAQILGVKCGIHYTKKLYFGLGYNQLYRAAPTFNKYIRYTNAANRPDSVTAKLRLWYISAHAEYIFHQTGKWRLSMPLQFGLGKTYYKYILAGRKSKRDENMNFIYEPAVAIEYKLIKWLGLGADIGFRFMISDDRNVIRNFTSPTYAFRLQIYYSELLRLAFPKKEWVKKL